MGTKSKQDELSERAKRVAEGIAKQIPLSATENDVDAWSITHRVSLMFGGMPALLLKLKERKGRQARWLCVRLDDTRDLYEVVSIGKDNQVISQIKSVPYTLIGKVANELITEK